MKKAEVRLANGDCARISSLERQVRFRGLGGWAQGAKRSGEETYVLPRVKG